MSKICFNLPFIQFTKLFPLLYVEIGDQLLLDENENLIVTKKNAIIISYCILSCLEETTSWFLLRHQRLNGLYRMFAMVLLEEEKTSSLFMTLGWLSFNAGTIQNYKSNSQEECLNEFLNHIKKM